MRTSRRRRSKLLTPRRLVRGAIAAVIVIFAGWWVVTTNLLAASSGNPLIGARIAPGDPRVRIGTAMLSFYMRGGAVPADEQRRAMDALRAAPLAEDPFLIAGVDALAKGREAEGERLLMEARRRNPRFRMARLLLLNQYLRAGRVREAAVEIAAIDRLVVGADTVLTPYLAKIVEDPKTGPAMIPMLRRQPVLQDRVLAVMANDGSSTSLILQLAGNRIRPSANPPAWQKSLLTRLLDGRRFDEALALWRRLSGDAGTGSEKGLYDPAFRRLPGPAPLNWDLTAGGLGVAEPVKGPALSVEYFGRDDGDLAVQMLMLRPGRYRLTFRAEGNADGASSRLVWSVSCGNDPLVQIPVTDVHASAKPFAASFTIPAGCPAQWIRLRGAAGDVQTPQSATFSALSLRPEANP